MVKSDTAPPGCRCPGRQSSVFVSTSMAFVTTWTGNLSAALGTATATSLSCVPCQPSVGWSASFETPACDSSPRYLTEPLPINVDGLIGVRTFRWTNSVFTYLSEQSLTRPMEMFPYKNATIVRRHRRIIFWVDVDRPQTKDTCTKQKRTKTSIFDYIFFEANRNILHLLFNC